MNRNMPIGVFDSGLGGLTVLKALQKTLPNESFIYIGDTAHVPYGNKSKSSIIHYSTTLSNFLINTYNVKMIIVACNTASAIAITTLQNLFTDALKLSFQSTVRGKLCSSTKGGDVNRPSLSKVSLGPYNRALNPSYSQYADDPNTNHLYNAGAA